jgi:hypothetical protein
MIFFSISCSNHQSKDNSIYFAKSYAYSSTFKQFVTYCMVDGSTHLELTPWETWLGVGLVGWEEWLTVFEHRGIP